MNSQKISLKTNMSCAKCVAKVRPALEAAGVGRDLEFDMSSPDKLVRFTGGAIEREKAVTVLQGLGYGASEWKGGGSGVAEPGAASLKIFWPLALIAMFLMGVTALVEIRAGAFDLMRSMSVFMGAFFLTFSFFKLLDLGRFADAFATYDLIGRHSRAYGLAYPFMELALGVGFLLHAWPTAVNSATAALMVVGNLGVWKVLREKRSIQCACLGTVFQLPMTKVTLFENTLMLVMAVAALLA